MCLLSVIMVSVLPFVSSHSWLDCIDYVPATKTCRGRPRNWYKQPSMPFARDVGRDIRPGQDVPGGLFCDKQKEAINTPVTAGYTADAPMAKVAPGQKITMTWPAKNHATVGEQRGVELFISKTAGAGDDFSHIASKAAWLAKYPDLTKTYSNCEPNQAGVDNAFCQGEFTVPSDLSAGVYTFMWWWEFNKGEFYNSCADVDVSGTAANPGPAPTTAPVGGETAAPTPAPTPAPTLPPCKGNATSGAPKKSMCPTGGDCTLDHNCCGDGQKCYHKDLYYAGCLSECTGPGYINPSDPPEFKTPWSCTVLSSVEVKGLTCGEVTALGGNPNMAVVTASASAVGLPVLVTLCTAFMLLN